MPAFTSPVASATRRALFRHFAGAAALSAVHGAALAQSPAWPNKPLRVIVPYVPGGTTDALARYIAAGIAPSLGQSVVVENRPGAGSIIGTDQVARAPADGYTLGMVVSAHAIQPWMNPHPPYDAVDDFSFITLIARVPKVILANPGVPATNLAELLALARREPRYAAYGSSGIGSAAHLGMELLNGLASSSFVHVPYKGTGAAVSDLIGGQLPLLVADVNNAVPLVQSGKARAIAVLGPQRLALLPGVGTLGDLFPGESVTELYGLVGPKGLPPEIVNRLQAEVRRLLLSRDAQERFTQTLGIAFAASSPEEFRAVVAQERERWGQVVRTAKVRLD